MKWCSRAITEYSSARTASTSSLIRRSRRAASSSDVDGDRITEVERKAGSKEKAN